MKLDLNYVTTRWHYLQQHPAFKKSPVQATFRILYWGIHCALGIPATIQLPRWNCKFFLPPKFRRAGSTGIFITREDYEPELAYLENLLSPGDVFVDGGANFGIYTVVAASLVGSSGRVLSFEPGEASFAILQKNIDINQFDNVTAFQAGLSDREGTARFYHIENAPNSYSLGAEATSTNNFEEIVTTTLDRVLETEKLDRLDALKLDVEGAEEMVLRGSQSTLEQYRPIVLFEISESATQRLGLKKDGAWQFLQQLGYSFFTIRDRTDLVELETPKLGNNIAIHKDKRDSKMATAIANIQFPTT
jgi:FkbM family methyltransferase